MGFYRGEILLPARAITSKINLKKKTTNFSIKGRQFVSDPNFLVLSSVCVDSKKEPNLLGLLFFFLPLSIFGRFQSLWTFFFFLVNGNAFPSFFSIYLEIERCWLVGWPMNWLKKQNKKQKQKNKHLFKVDDLYLSFSLDRFDILQRPHSGQAAIPISFRQKIK